MIVQICPKWLCIYGFVNKFWTGRIFERLRTVCGGSNLSTVLLLWGIYIKKGISLVRICLQTRNARNASTKFRKTSESENSPNPLWRIGAGEISRNLPFSRFSSSGSKLTCHHVMCVRFRCKTVCGQFRCTQILQRVDYPLGDDGSCTWPLSAGAQRHACKRNYVIIYWLYHVLLTIQQVHCSKYRFHRYI